MAMKNPLEATHQPIVMNVFDAEAARAGAA